MPAPVGNPKMRSRRHGLDIVFRSPEVQSSARSPRHSRRPRRVDAHGHGRRRPRRRLQPPLRLRAAARLPGSARLALGRRAPQRRPLRGERPLRRRDAAAPALGRRARRQGQLALGDPRQGEDRLGDRRRLVRQGRQVLPRLHRCRAAVCTRACGRAEERLLAARRLHDPPRQLRRRALEPVARERRARRRRPGQLHRRDQPRRPDGASSTSLRSARAPSTTWAARRTSPTRRPSPSSRS